MTRLNPELPSAEQISTVLTDQDLTVYARLIWTYLNVADEPQNSSSLIDALGISPSTVSRSVAALLERGLIRRVSGVWLAEEAR
ncbi:MarR family transcriptional regulator [Streptomyces sp. NBC_01589]|uniref:MarR family transcriptional regulator n=1 Tax=unclassified Streptomyces TaxID=2593676 RepID=UPI00386C0E2C